MKIIVFIISICILGFVTLDSQTVKTEQSLDNESTGLSRTHILNKTYSPDNNPVTYDENPTNYPLNKPDTYINIEKIEVQSPTHYNSIPEGVSAICRDGTYSFSRNRRGTCSHHGGVETWLK